MEKWDRVFAFIVGVLVTGCGIYFKWDYSQIADSGLTLSSIVLAVYVAAIVGLINSDLTKKMQKTVALPQKDRTQLGVLTLYFKIAVACSVGTILVSSLILLIPAPKSTELLFSYGWSALSICGLVLYAENLTFLVIIIRFMLNRQIWNE